MNPPIPMPPLIWQLLQKRGLTTKEEIEKFLSPSLKDLTDPLQLHDMDKAVARLKTAWEKQEKISIYGDYDLDGSSGIALLVRGLEGLGFDHVSLYQPSRFLEGYGINKEALKIIKERGDEIVISVDCGITAVEEAEEATRLGLDLIITDHHLPKAKLPVCVAVINPNKGLCESSLGHLSGVGVAFYLIMALKRELKIEFDLKSLLDFFSIGTITDMVPLIKENRILLKHGLKVLSQTQRPGLRALIQALGLENREFDSSDVSFGIGPKLNALSRLEKGLRPLDILMCENEKAAPVLAQEVLRLNEERKKIQEDLTSKIIEQLTKEELENPAIVLAATGHAGVVGLSATKVSQLTGKPTFIVAYFDGEGVGSARGQAGDILPDALAVGKDFLDRFGGHAQAAGFSLKPENFNDLKAAILNYYKNQKTKIIEKVSIDFVEADISEINENVMNWIAQMGPFGQTNPQPVIKITSPVNRVSWMKNLHLKLHYTGADAVGFFAKDKKPWVKAVESIQGDSGVTVLAEPTWNYFRGRKTLQFLIREISN